MKGFALDREDRPGNTRVPLVNAQRCFTRFPFACALNVVCTVLVEAWQIVVQLQCNLCNRDLERGLRLLWPVVGAPGGLAWYMRRASCAEHRAPSIVRTLLGQIIDMYPPEHFSMKWVGSRPL